MYKFSVPMPYTKEHIDKIININKQVTKSKITSLYAGLPSTCNMFSGFEQCRNSCLNQTDFDYWKNLFSYSMERGCDFIYLLNSPLAFNTENINFRKRFEKLDKLLNQLYKIGINKLRVANPQLSSYLYRHYKQFNIYASTSLNYKTISEYKNLIQMHPEIKQIVPSHDLNKNFRFLKNLTKNYPTLNIEIIVNEGCMKGCPHRSLHENVNSNFKFNMSDLSLSENYCITFCTYLSEKYPFKSLTLNNNIFPWELEEYSKIGINNFKLVGRDTYNQEIEYSIIKYYLYFLAIENLKKIEYNPITTFIHHLNSNEILNQLSIKDVFNYLPKINYFKKYAHLCSSRCGVECFYCYKCAEKIQKVFEKKIKEKSKQPHYVPACNIS